MNKYEEYPLAYGFKKGKQVKYTTANRIEGIGTLISFKDDYFIVRVRKGVYRKIYKTQIEKYFP